MALDQSQLNEFLYAMATRGYHVFNGFLQEDQCVALRAGLESAIREYRPRAGSVRSEQDAYLLHDLLCTDIVFARLLEDPRLQQLMAPLLGEHWIMYAFTSSSLPPGDTNYGHRIHVDSPRFVAGYPFNLGMIWTLDEFTAENGATEVLAGSHHSADVPNADFFENNCQRAVCGRGGLIVFNARLFHRSGVNRTDQWRHSLTMNTCRSYMKQRMDWVRFVPDDISRNLNSQARRLIGFDTRLPTSLDEFFVPEDRRLYKPGQG
jgi:ectoine hydroxylase-related dioxygenase (phytanoyl-CoA dioxygenase family)